MKDFDSERKERHEKRLAEMGDRQFKIGGEVFTYRANVPYDVLRDIAALNNQTPGDEVISTLERTVLDLIENSDGSHERFLETARRETVTFEDMNALATYLIEEQVGRPTTAPSPSTPGREATGTY